MAYNSKNYNIWVQKVIDVYRLVKTKDKPDSEIVRVEFPKHNIHISYRQWMNIKGRPLKKETPISQLDLFREFPQ